MYQPKNEICNVTLSTKFHVFIKCPSQPLFLGLKIFSASSFAKDRSDWPAQMLRAKTWTRSSFFLRCTYISTGNLRHVGRGGFLTSNKYAGLVFSAVWAYVALGQGSRVRPCASTRRDHVMLLRRLHRRRSNITWLRLVDDQTRPRPDHQGGVVEFDYTRATFEC